VSEEGQQIHQDEVVLDASDYRPNPTQRRFHASRAKVKAFLAGYRGGKTRAGGEECLALAAENEGLDGLIVAPTMGLLHRVTLRAFHDWESRTGTCPADLIEYRNADKRYFQLINGSRVYYGSADRPGSLEGTTLSWWWLDEARLVRREAWRILVARLSDPRARRMQGLVTSTPAPGWLQEEFGTEREEREVFHGSTRENAGNLPKGYVEGLERTYSRREARVLIDGEFGLLVGAVLEEFERKRHLIEWRYNPSLRTVATIDFGSRRPYVGWAQQIPAGTLIPGYGRALPGTWVIFDELTPEGTTTELLMVDVKAKGYHVDTVYCDPAGDGAQPALGLSDVAIVKAAGFKPVRFLTEPRYRHIPFGIGLLRGLLQNVAGETRLFVARSLEKPKALRGAVKDFEGYAYPEAKEGKPVGDVPLKDGLHDHGVDAWRYFAVNEYVRTGGLGHGSESQRAR
jgi:Terminase large subunit, T4likevirus-type, N-terminal